MIKWCLMVEEMQYCVGLMSTTLSNLQSVTALSTVPNFLVPESLWPWLTFHFFIPASVLLLRVQILTPQRFLLCFPPPPALVCLHAAVAMLSAVVPVSWHLSSHLLCTCFHSIDFTVSSFIAWVFLLFPHLYDPPSPWQMEAVHFSFHLKDTSLCSKRW